MTPVEILKQSLHLQQLSHLYLLVGSQGDNRDQTILEMVQLLTDHLGKSKHELIEKQKVMWVESDTQVIKKEQIQQLFTEFSKTSLQHQRKVYVIEDAEKLNTASANTLLKFMEEPESKTSVGILVASNQQALLDTIVSRSHILKLSEPSIDTRKKTFLELDISPFEAEIYAILYHNHEDVLHAKEDPSIQEMIALFHDIIEERNNKHYVYEMYEKSMFLADKDMLHSFMQILYRFFVDLKTIEEHRHFTSLHETIESLALEIDQVQLDEAIQIVQGFVKQVRYFVQTELLRRRLLHVIRDVMKPLR